MNRLTKLIDKKIDLSNPKNINSIINEIKKLSSGGFKEVSISIEGSIRENLSDEGIDENVFNKIIETQELPEWVVYNLFKSQGGITNKNFSNKIDSFDK
jgi:hypothetical protein